MYDISLDGWLKALKKEKKENTLVTLHDTTNFKLFENSEFMLSCKHEQTIYIFLIADSIIFKNWNVECTFNQDEVSFCDL